MMALDVLSSCHNFAGDYTKALEKAEQCLGIVSDPIAVQLTTARKAAALLGLGRISEASKIFHELHDAFLAGKLLLPLAVIDPQIGLAKVLHGDIAKGVRWIEGSRKRVSDWGFENINRNWGFLSGPDFYMAGAPARKAASWSCVAEHRLSAPESAES